MSELFSSSPALTPRIKVWLKNNCRLIGFIGPEESKTPGQRFESLAAMTL